MTLLPVGPPPIHRNAPDDRIIVDDNENDMGHMNCHATDCDIKYSTEEGLKLGNTSSAQFIFDTLLFDIPP